MPPLDRSHTDADVVVAVVVVVVMDVVVVVAGAGECAANPRRSNCKCG